MKISLSNWMYKGLKILLHLLLRGSYFNNLEHSLLDIFVQTHVHMDTFTYFLNKIVYLL